jgi:hypothetical protein
MNYFENAAHALSTMSSGSLAALIVFLILFVIVFSAAFLPFFGAAQGFHNLKLAYLISSEDIDNLTRKEMRKTKRMSYEELTTFLAERFPNSTPALVREV